MKFIYNNPTPSRVTIDEVDHNLRQGENFTLDENNAYVKCLIDQGHLVEVKEEPPVAIPDDFKINKNNK